jgi:hypothetical protein
MSLSYINYKGKRILYVDYTQCKTTEEMLKVLEDVKKEYENTTHMFISINDFRGTFGSSEFMKRASQLGKELFDKRTLKTTVLGITGIKKILLNGYNALVKNKLVPFDTKEEALEYLVK